MASSFSVNNTTMYRCNFWLIADYTEKPFSCKYFDNLINQQIDFRYPNISLLPVAFVFHSKIEISNFLSKNYYFPRNYYSTVIDFKIQMLLVFIKTIENLKRRLVITEWIYKRGTNLFDTYSRGKNFRFRCVWHVTLLSAIGYLHVQGSSKDLYAQRALNVNIGHR